MRCAHLQVIDGLKGLRPQVLRSREVQFALEVYGVYQHGNWQRFFQLVEGAPYIAACLMHFFFNNIRARALRLVNDHYVSASGGRGGLPYGSSFERF